MKKVLISLIIYTLTLCVTGIADEKIKDGAVKDYYPDGQLKSEVTYKDAKKDGMEYAYDENGKPSAEWYWEKGEVLRYKAFFTDGKVAKETVVDKNGDSVVDKNGHAILETAKEYYESGKIARFKQAVL